MSLLGLWPPWRGRARPISIPDGDGCVYLNHTGFEHRLTRKGEIIMIDQEIFDGQVKADRFPFPSEGDITLVVRNSNYTLGPVMLHLVMNPGAVIPAHVHKNVVEVLYIAEGDFIMRANSTRPVLRCTLKPARHTVRTVRQPDARYSSPGLSPRRSSPAISATSRLQTLRGRYRNFASSRWRRCGGASV
jgi:hypothetical protein